MNDFSGTILVQTVLLECRAQWWFTDVQRFWTRTAVHWNRRLPAFRTLVRRWNSSRWMSELAIVEKCNSHVAGTSSLRSSQWGRRKPRNQCKTISSKNIPLRLFNAFQLLNSLCAMGEELWHAAGAPAKLARQIKPTLIWPLIDFVRSFVEFLQKFCRTSEHNARVVTSL